MEFPWIAIVSPIILSVLLFFWWRWRAWCKDFRDCKYERWRVKCVSNSLKPPPQPRNEVKSALIAAAMKWHPSIVNYLVHKSNVTRKSPELLNRGRACPVVQPFGPFGPKLLSSTAGPNSTRNMDHILVTFWDYLWASLFVGPNAVFLGLTGILGLMVRQAMHRRGWLSPKPFDPRRLVGELVLEGMLVTHFTCIRDVEGEEIATFCWLNFPMLDNNGSLNVADFFTVDINLTTKRMTMSRLDEKFLTPSDTVILVCFNIISGNVMEHAYANWGVNDSIENSFVRRMSVVTVMYNYFGYTAFQQLTALWYFCGLCRNDFSKFTHVVDHSLKEGIRDHSEIHKLMRHSTIVNFIIKVQNHFLNVFQKYRDEFHGIDGEAMFIGTILHSLDHTLFEWTLEDPLWLDTDSKEFGAMAEFCRFVRVGFVSDLPALLFNRRYKDAPHPFYKEVYRHAARINGRLADHMDACIIK